MSKNREAARAAHEARAKAGAEYRRRLALKETERERAVQAAFKAANHRERHLDAFGSDTYYIRRVAPRLLEDPTYNRISRDLIRVHPGIRPLSAWEPKGKGKLTLFRSLCDHLYSRYPTPAFLWNVFFVEDATNDLWSRYKVGVRRIAMGASLYDLVKSGEWPVPFTRAQCHDFLTGTTSDTPFLEAIRRVQVRSVGGDTRLWRAWCSDRAPGAEPHDRPGEEFWATVLQWLARIEMFDPGQVGPLSDYIRFRRVQDPSFSMKGRSPAALLAAMNEWHTDLQKVRVSRNAVYAPSGFNGFYLDNSREGHSGHIRDIWRIREILSPKELAEEGRNQKHCVFSYEYSITKGTTSIWSMTHENDQGNWHALTIEVRNASRAIVQARGMMNRLPDAREANVLAQWAASAGLRVSTGSSW